MRSKQWFTFVTQIHIEFLFFQLIVDVTFVGTFFAGFGVVNTPSCIQFAEEMLTAEGKVHGTLAFQTGVAVIGRAAFGLYTHGTFVVNRTVFVAIVILFQVDTFHGEAVTVFPIIAIIEDTFKGEFVVFVNIPVEGGGITLTLSGDVVLTNLVVGDAEFSGFYIFVPYKFNIVRTGRRVLVRSGKHDSQFVVEETVTISKS